MSALIILIDSTNQNTNVYPHYGPGGLAPKILNHFYLKNEQYFKINVGTKNISIRESFGMKSRKRG